MNGDQVLAHYQALIINAAIEHQRELCTYPDCDQRIDDERSQMCAAHVSLAYAEDLEYDID